MGTNESGVKTTKIQVQLINKTNNEQLFFGYLVFINNESDSAVGRDHFYLENSTSNKVAIQAAWIDKLRALVKKHDLDACNVIYV